MKVSKKRITSAVSFKKVNFKIDKKNILTDVNLDIEKGKIIGILGLNGAGKTTLLSLVSGLKKMSSGDILVFGEKISSSGDVFKKRIGVVLQETALYEELTVFENLKFLAALYHVSNSGKRIAEVLELLGLADRFNEVIKNLSGGLKRRVAIARALLHEPELLIIDEPTLGVDVETRHAIWSHLKLLRSRGNTVLVATNYLDEAQALCDKVAVLKEGKLLALETPNLLVAKTGGCLDIECDIRSAKKITSIISGIRGVLRTEQTLSGLTIFLKSAEVSEVVVNKILKVEQINGFHFRPADLAEVFRALGDKE